MHSESHLAQTALRALLAIELLRRTFAAKCAYQQGMAIEINKGIKIDDRLLRPRKERRRFRNLRKGVKLPPNLLS